MRPSEPTADVALALGMDKASGMRQSVPVNRGRLRELYRLSLAASFCSDRRPETFGSVSDFFSFCRVKEKRARMPL